MPSVWLAIFDISAIGGRDGRETLVGFGNDHCGVCRRVQSMPRRLQQGHYRPLVSWKGGCGGLPLFRHIGQRRVIHDAKQTLLSNSGRDRGAEGRRACVSRWGVLADPPARASNALDAPPAAWTPPPLVALRLLVCLWPALTPLPAWFVW